MKKKYFTALLPSTHIVGFCQNIQRELKLMTTIPPMIILEYHNSPILLKDFDRNINEITEFNTSNIIEEENRLYLTVPSSPLNRYFPINEDILKIYLGYKTSTKEYNPEPEPMVIRNWELGFYELKQWDEKWPSSHFSLIELWKIKKRRPKG